MKPTYLKAFLLAACLIAKLPASAEQSNAIPPMPQRFQGVYLGMSMEDLTKLRPQVTSFWHRTSEEKVDVAVTNQTLSEIHRIRDPEWGMLGATNNLKAGMLGMYSFKDGVLNSFTFIWTGDVEKIRECQTKFVSWCVQHWGNNFERKTKTENKGSNAEQLCPVLLWHKGDLILVVVCTSNLTSHRDTGIMLFTVFHRDDKSLVDSFSGEEVDPAVLMLNENPILEVSSINRHLALGYCGDRSTASGSECPVTR
jgi:hypothetical protein